MIHRLIRFSRSLAIAMAAAIVTLALSSSPAAVADDRLDFTGTSLSGAPGRLQRQRARSRSDVWAT